MKNKEEVLHYIQLAEQNLRRLRTLVETDLAQPETKVSKHCCVIVYGAIINIGRLLNEEVDTEEHEQLYVKIAGAFHRVPKITWSDQTICLCEDGNPVSNPDCPFHGRNFKQQ